MLPGRTVATSYSNAGELAGVVTVHHPDAYGYIAGGDYRVVEQYMSPFISAADYKLYWGTAGKIDSVIDITHDEPVPFKPTIANSWGVLNASAVPAAGSYDRRDELTAADFPCVEPMRTPSGHLAAASPR